MSLATAAAVTERVRLSTAVALPVEHDPISLAKPLPPLTICRRPGQRRGRVRLEHRRTDRPSCSPGRRRTILREYIEAMRALWTQEEAAYDGEFVQFGPSWAWPKPRSTHVPVLVGAAGTENFTWIARSADGWITTRAISTSTRRCVNCRRSGPTRPRGRPQIVALDFKPVPEVGALGAGRVTEVLFGLPDTRSVAEVGGYVERLAGKLAALI